MPGVNNLKCSYICLRACVERLDPSCRVQSFSFLLLAFSLVLLHFTFQSSMCPRAKSVIATRFLPRSTAKCLSTGLRRRDLPPQIQKTHACTTYGGVFANAHSLCDCPPADCFSVGCESSAACPLATARLRHACDRHYDLPSVGRKESRGAWLGALARWLLRGLGGL